MFKFDIIGSLTFDNWNNTFFKNTILLLCLEILILKNARYPVINFFYWGDKDLFEQTAGR